VNVGCRDMLKEIWNECERKPALEGRSIAGFYRGIILHETDGLLRSVIQDWSGRLYATGSGPGHVSTYASSRLQL
jgi:hypothetical protein